MKADREAKEKAEMMMQQLIKEVHCYRFPYIFLFFILGMLIQEEIEKQRSVDMREKKKKKKKKKKMVVTKTGSFEVLRSMVRFILSIGLASYC